jgi:(R)-2-hydroxyglutarate---pyruvate transhydrogenase
MSGQPEGSCIPTPQDSTTGMLSVVRRSCFSLRTRRFNHSSAPRLNSVTEHDLAHFAKILPKASILSTYPPSSTPPEELDQFNTDWMGKYRGHSTTVLKPKTTKQVSEILKWCNEKRIGIVPQGGNTGLVGGSIPVRDEVIISLALMSTVRSFDPVSGNYHSGLSSLLYYKLTSFSSQCTGILVADAGCILQSLTDYIAPYNHIMPVDLGAKGRYV